MRGDNNSDSCSDWFSISRTVDRTNGEDRQPCVVPELTDAGLRACFQRRARQLGRPIKITLIGDSRARFVYATFANMFMIDLPGRQGLAFNATAYLPEASPAVWLSSGLSAHQVKNDLVDLSLEWFPFLNKFASSALSSLARACAKTEVRHADCPDLLLVNSGVWYSSRCPRLDMHRQEVLALMFRRHLQDSLPSLRSVSRLTPTFWMLDQPVFTDFARDRLRGERQASVENKLQMAVQTITLEKSAEVS